MDFVFIDELLVDYTINLEALVPNGEQFGVSIYQHIGVFHFNDNFFGNQDDQVDKFNNFLRIAKQNNSAFAITPEYSCPIETIENVLQNAELFPDTGKLWILGGHSITPDQIIEFKNGFEQAENIEIHFEVENFNHDGGVLLDPCYYLFKSLDANLEEKLIVLVQFKTQNMGVWNNDLERQKLIPGTKTYILRNGNDSINLITIICSEAIEFGINNYPNRWHIDPYMVINIQMNPNPSHHTFREFRNRILNVPNKDLISLNWSSEGSSSWDPNFFSSYSKSNISISTNHITNTTPQEEIDLERNHIKGLYYSFMKPLRHCFHLNPNIEIAVFRLSKVHPGGTNPVLYRRRGPRVDAIFCSNQDDDFDEISCIDDGFTDFINGLNIQSASLLKDDFRFIDKERLVNLTVGDIDKYVSGESWHQINKLKSFIINDTECINRFTVTFDESGEDYRIQRILKIEELNKIILTDPNQYPDVIASFKGNCNEVMFLNNNGFDYKYNLVTFDNENCATVVFLGQVPISKVLSTFKNMLELFPEKYRKHERVIIWYKADVNRYAYKSSETPTINDTNPNNLTSIV